MGTEKTVEYLNLGEEFFSWDHAFEGPQELAASIGETPESHMLKELPPRTDFFEQHETQRKKK
jgi:methionyl-tRNA synthetase